MDSDSKGGGRSQGNEGKFAILSGKVQAEAEIPDSTPVAFLTVGQLRAIVRETLEDALDGRSLQGEERLLTPEEAARLLNTTPRWLYRHAKSLPFTRRLSRKALRFSEKGVRRWLAAKGS